MLNRLRNILLAGTVVCVGTYSAAAANREGVNFVNVASDGAVQSRAAVFAGGYTVKSLLLSGTFTMLSPATRASEAVIEVVPPGGQPIRVQPLSDATLSTAGTSNPSRTLNRWVFRLPAPVNAAGAWSFRFSESVNHTGVDGRWDSITIQLNDGPPSNAIDVGTLGIGHTERTSTTTAQVNWFRFQLAVDAAPAAARYLITGVETLTSGIDAAMALYDADGRLLRTDEDDGVGTEPILTLGAPGPWRQLVSDALPLDGRDGPLPAGVYYVAVASGPAVFQPGFSATVAGSATAGLFRLHVNTNAGVTPVPPRPPFVFQRR